MESLESPKEERRRLKDERASIMVISCGKNGLSDEAGKRVAEIDARLGELALIDPIKPKRLAESKRRRKKPYSPDISKYCQNKDVNY